MATRAKIPANMYTKTPYLENDAISVPLFLEYLKNRTRRLRAFCRRRQGFLNDEVNRDKIDQQDEGTRPQKLLPILEKKMAPSAGPSTAPKLFAVMNVANTCRRSSTGTRSATIAELAGYRWRPESDADKSGIIDPVRRRQREQRKHDRLREAPSGMMGRRPSRSANAPPSKRR